MGLNTPNPPRYATGEDNIKMDLHKLGWGGAGTGLIWLRIRAGVGDL